MEDQKVQEKNSQDTMLLWVKIQTCLTGAVLVLLLIVGIFAGIQAGKVMQMFRGVDMDQINATVLALQNAAGGLQDVDMDTINKAVASLKGAAENLAAADIDAVNDGIQALTEAAENLQGLDIEKMNELIESLKTVSEEMEKTTSAFSKIFGR